MTRAARENLNLRRVGGIMMQSRFYLTATGVGLLLEECDIGFDVWK